MPPLTQPTRCLFSGCAWQGEQEPLEIAMKELRAGKIPFTIRRYLPDGSFEDWKVSELTVETAVPPRSTHRTCPTEARGDRAGRPCENCNL